MVVDIVVVADGNVEGGIPFTYESALDFAELEIRRGNGGELFLLSRTRPGGYKDEYWVVRMFQPGQDEELKKYTYNRPFVVSVYGKYLKPVVELLTGRGLTGLEKLNLEVRRLKDIQAREGHEQMLMSAAREIINLRGE